MPQITIREYDNTRPGIGNYTNMSVLIPGVVNAENKEAFDAAADINGIVELDTKTKFKKLVGFRDVDASKTTKTVVTKERAFASAAERAGGWVPCVATAVESPVVADLGTYYEKSAETVTEETAYVDVDHYAYTLTTDTAITEGKTYYTVVLGLNPYDQDIPGYSIKYKNAEAFNAESLNKYTFAPMEETPDDSKGKNIFKAETTGSITYFRITKATGWTADTQYLVINKSNNEDQIGNDEETKEVSIRVQMGNQIAWELINQGFVVLYKDITDTWTDDPTDTTFDWAKVFDEEFLADKANYDFRFITSGLINYTNEANKVMTSLAIARGDCTALCDVDEDAYNKATLTTPKDVIGAIQDELNKQIQSKYSAIFVPTVCYKNISVGYTNCKFPGSFHYLVCFARTLANNNPEWFAPAGLSRGISDYNVISAGAKLGEVAVKNLEPRYQIDLINKPTTEGASTTLTCAGNVIEYIRGNYYLWGNRTTHKLGIKDSTDGDLVASHFLNVRQLCSTLKKQIYVACHRYTFDPNNDTLWFNFCNAIIPTLEAMKANQGIEAYDIVKIRTDKKALLKARIRIVPIEAVEDFEIDVVLVDELGDVNVEIAE